MKKICIYLAALVLLCLTSVRIQAQNTSWQSFQDSTDFSTYATNGRACNDAGRAIVMSGATLAATGVGLMLHTLFLQESGPYPVMNVAPVYALGMMAGGGIIALAGWPLLSRGKQQMTSSGTSQLIFGNEHQKGFNAMIELGRGLGRSISVDAVAGYHFNENFFLGAGAGLRPFIINDHIDKVAKPLYVNTRYTFGDKRVDPYVSTNLGYEPLSQKLYSSLEFGSRIRNIRSERGSSWWIGSRMENLDIRSVSTISIKLGKSF